MADNIYVFESYTDVGTQQITDDGTGIDWIFVRDTHSYQFGAWGTFVDMHNTGWVFVNYNIYPGGITTAHSLIVFGQIENIQGGAGNEHIVGSDFANVIAGDPDGVAGNYDELFGNAGNDTIYGGGGDDTIFGGADSDLIFGDRDPNAQSAGNIAMGDDSLFGDAGADTLMGNEGNNTLDGGTGHDTADYSGFFDDFGNYSYSVSIMLSIGAATVTQHELQGGATSAVASDRLVSIDTVLGTGGNDYMGGFSPLDLGEFNGCTFYGGDGNDTLAGDYGVDAIYGGNGSDNLSDGGNHVHTGYDVLNGGAGDDYYTVDDAGTRVIENTAADGYDRVFSWVTSYTLPRNVEALYLFTIDGGGVNGTGNGLNNQIEGDQIANQLSGLAGDDFALGNAGADTLFGGAGADGLYGGTEGDKLYGGTQADVLYGEAGSDWLYGGSENDTLYGGTQADHLSGGAGVDRLSGGGGADVFLFAKGQTGTGAARDTITDFATSVDKIDLRGIMAGQEFIQNAAFSHTAGEVRYVASTGILAGDTDGNGGADYQIYLGQNRVLVDGDLIL